MASWGRRRSIGCDAAKVLHGQADFGKALWILQHLDFNNVFRKQLHFLIHDKLGAIGTLTNSACMVGPVRMALACLMETHIELADIDTWTRVCKSVAAGRQVIPAGCKRSSAHTFVK